MNKARELGIDQLLITCDEVNSRSRRVVEGNNGILDSVANGICRYWIKIF